MGCRRVLELGQEGVAVPFWLEEYAPHPSPLFLSSVLILLILYHVHRIGRRDHRYSDHASPFRHRLLRLLARNPPEGPGLTLGRQGDQRWLLLLCEYRAVDGRFGLEGLNALLQWEERKVSLDSRPERLRRSSGKEKGGERQPASTYCWLLIIDQEALGRYWDSSTRVR